MAKIHMVLQGKGGVGKSFIAAVIAQYKMGNGQTPLCIDTDPVNATFHGFKALNVRMLEIMEGDEIKARNFDTLVELIAPSKDDVVIDNGASSFVPMTHYLISNQVPALLQEMGHEMVVPSVARLFLVPECQRSYTASKARRKQQLRPVRGGTGPHSRNPRRQSPARAARAFQGTVGQCRGPFPAAGIAARWLWPARLAASGALVARNCRHRSKPSAAPSVTITCGTQAPPFRLRCPRCSTRCALPGRSGAGRFPDRPPRMPRLPV
jgi:hypothetical protein